LRRRMAALSGKIGRWTVLGHSEKKVYGRLDGHDCRCDCGTERTIATSRLLRRLTLSCGCASVEASAVANLRHGLSRHPLVPTWRAMKERCQRTDHTAYARYGGRGIKVCERWQSIENFVADNEHLALPGLTLDRRDNDGDYCPENCRWVTRRTQSNNRSDCVYIEHSGRRMTCAEWARELGTSEVNLRNRIRAGWPAEKALSHPVRRYGAAPP
jgi:hypothetical protein